MYICVYMYMNTYVCVFLYVYICDLCIFRCVYMYGHMYNMCINMCIYVWVYVWICVYLYVSSSSSCHIASMDLPDCLSPPVSIVHHSQEVFKAISCIGTELLYIGSSWLFCLCLSMWRGPLEYITYEFILTSPAVSHMSGSSNFDSFHDGW